MALTGVIFGTAIVEGSGSLSFDFSFAPSSVVASGGISQLLSAPNGFNAFQFAAVGIDSVETTDPSTGATSQQSINSGGRSGSGAPAFAGDDISRLTFGVSAIGGGSAEMLAQFQILFWG